MQIKKLTLIYGTPSKPMVTPNQQDHEVPGLKAKTHNAILDYSGKSSQSSCCDKAFAHDGKLRKEREVKPNIPTATEEPARKK